MRTAQQPSGMSRRSFIQGVGVTFGTLLTSPMSSWAFNPATGPPLRVGVLIPPSGIHPALGDSLTAGLRLGFAQGAGQAGAPPVKLIAEAVDTGLSSAVEKSRKLLEQDQVDVVVAVLSSGMAARLSSLFEEHRALLVVSNMGADVVRQDEQSPYVYHSTLNYWQANWAMGNWAAQHLGHRAFVAASFHESGYDAHYAFRHGFEAAGGNIVENRITHMHAHSGDLLHVIAAVRQARPDFVYASYSGRPAIDFVKAYASSGLNEKVPLIGSGFLAEDTYLPALGDAALGIKTCMPWAPSLDTDQNRAFVAAYRQQSGRCPDIFAVLGYDSARLIAEALHCAGWDPSRSERLQQTFRSVECDSPRGRLRMHAQTSSTSGPLYLREVVRRDGVLRNEVIAELDRTNEREQFIEPMRLSLNTGWLNPYLCT